VSNDQHRDGRDRGSHLALVTGAGTGVGRAVALALAGQRIPVVLVGRREAPLERVAAEIAGAGAAVIPADVSDPEAVKALSERMAAEYGTVDILVNAAGVHGEIKPILRSTPSRWIRTIMINTVGPYLTCRAFMGGMMEKGWGRIVNVTSASSLGEPRGVNSAYPTSKVALNHFTRQLAAELQHTGVTANVIHPGEVRTEMWEAIRDDAVASGIEGAAAWAEMVERTGGDPPEKSGDLVLRLVDEEPGTTTGRFLWIDDGIQKPKPTW
jgi:NAD(P)-dependent dehydrogenase (short-subunit alcohol dehydrogenase family)